ncbi:uncharacterized protein [Haliotis cracherodii]|uniref:uncharacterized protein n=1 Tax=Haliotis cracherodii TaxID=6455 RepID=UPI0039E8E89F
MMAGQMKALRQLLAVLAVACIVDQTGGSASYRTRGASKGHDGYVQIQETGKVYDAASVQIQDPSQTNGTGVQTHASMSRQSQPGLGLKSQSRSQSRHGMKQSSHSYSSYSSGGSSSSRSHSSSRKSSYTGEGQVPGRSMGLKANSEDGQGGFRSQSYSSSGSMKHRSGGQGGSMGLPYNSGSQGSSRNQSYSSEGQTQGGSMGKSYSFRGQDQGGSMGKSYSSQVQGGTRNPSDRTGGQGQGASRSQSYSSGSGVQGGTRAGSQLIKKSDGKSLLFKLEYTDEQRIQHLNSQREAGRRTGGGYSVGAGGTLAAARRQVEEERRRQAEEERRQAEEERRQAEEERRRQTEEERRRQVDEERIKGGEERRQTEEERRQAEEDRRQAEEERRRQTEEERRRQVEEERRRLVEERRREGEELRREREEEERMRLEEERRREEARVQARRQLVDRQDGAEERREEEERRLMQERLRAEERRTIAARERQERIEEERVQRQREIEARQVSGETRRQTTVTQSPRSTPAARSSGARRGNVVSNRCTDCQVGNETFRGHSRFEYTENCQKYRCICHCDGSHDCPSHYTINVCDQEEDKERRRQESSCKSCDAKGKIVQGNNYFDLQDGCILHKNCKCFCDGRWECSANRTENTCVKKIGEGSCGECEVYGSFHPGNSRFKYEEGCFEYNCDCNCNGSWSCPPDRTRDICQKGCGECEIRGEFFEGNTYFTHEKACLEYTCFCNCNGSWNCSGDRVKNICDPTEQPDKCSQCQVSETDTYPGNSTFQLRKKCISYECSCKCDGSWDCPGVLARNICRGERPGGCKSCQVSDEEFYPGDSVFDMRKECIHYKCRCNCDGSWSCPGEKARDVCKGEVPGGCKSCKLSETEFYRGESDFQMRRDCIHYSCHCNCDGSWNCPGADARNVCRGEIPGGCRSCQLSDGRTYPGRAKFRHTNGCVVKDCKCSCNGTVVCDEETAVNVCSTPPPTRQRTPRPRQNLDNCQKCMVEGNDYEPNSNFKLKRGCYVYPCQCSCNGRWGCNRDDASDVCAAKSAAQRGSRIGQSSCQRCIVQGRNYPGDTDFRLRRGCISYKCKCACDGRWECPADKASNFCPGSREPTVGCKQCEVDGQSYTVDSNFDMRRGCVRYKCKCRCDGSYGCHVTQDSACTAGERPANCGNCEINGYIYPGNMGFVVREGCVQKECNCYCNGSFSCPEENRVDICRNKQASRLLRDGTFTSTGNLGETFGSGTQVFNQGSEQYTVTRRNQFRGGQPGRVGQVGQVGRSGQHIRSHGTQFQIPGGPMFPQGGRPYVLRGSIPLGGPISPGQIVTRGGQQYVLRGMRQFLVPGGGQFRPGGAIPYPAQRNFYQQIINPALEGQGKPGMGTPQRGVNSQYSYAQYSQTRSSPDVAGSLHGGVPTYNVRTSGATGGSRTVHTARTNGNQGGAPGRMAYGSAVFQVKAPYAPGKRTRHVGQVAVNPKPGCNECSVEGRKHRGGSTFQITKDCVQFNCSCECSGSWTCSGEFSTGCNTTEPSRKPQGDDAGTCKKCSLKGSTYPGDSTFQLVQDCSEYTCTCTCSGKWYCPVQSPRQICGRPRGELRQRTASCQLCDVRGTDYPPHSEFLLKEGCLQYKCTCNCDGTWVCPPANAVDVCQEDREKERREREQATQNQKYTTRLPQSWGTVFTTKVPVGQAPKTRYSNTRNGIAYKQTSCQSCVVKSKTYIPENEFKFREGCTQYKCQCFCNGTWECPPQDTINLCRSPDYRVDGCKQCEVKNETYPGGSPFRYREGCWEFSCFCGCNGEWSCPANRTTDTCKHSGSAISSRCKPCMIDGKVVGSKSNFNMRRGCFEFLCECNCDGSWTCPKDRSLNICEGEGKTPSPHYKLKGCTVGNRTFFSRLFAYTEKCIRYMCICYDGGAWKCPAQKSKRVC